MKEMNVHYQRLKMKGKVEKTNERTFGALKKKGLIEQQE